MSLLCLGWVLRIGIGAGFPVAFCASALQVGSLVGPVQGGEEHSNSTTTVHFNAEFLSLTRCCGNAFVIVSLFVVLALVSHVNCYTPIPARPVTVVL